MRRHLNFLLPDVAQCKNLVAELKELGLKDQDIHVMAREDIPLEGLHKANALQKTELTHGVEMGLGVGGVAGMLGGLLAVTFPPAGVALGGGAVILGTTLAGAGFGGLVSAFVAKDIPNHELEDYQSAVIRGEILLLLDVPTTRVAEIIALIEDHHPEVKVAITHPEENAARMRQPSMGQAA